MQFPPPLFFSLLLPLSHCIPRVMVSLRVSLTVSTVTPCLWRRVHCVGKTQPPRGRLMCWGPRLNESELAQVFITLWFLTTNDMWPVVSRPASVASLPWWNAPWNWELSCFCCSIFSQQQDTWLNHPTFLLSPIISYMFWDPLSRSLVFSYIMTSLNTYSHVNICI